MIKKPFSLAQCKDTRPKKSIAQDCEIMTQRECTDGKPGACQVGNWIAFITDSLFPIRAEVVTL